MQKSRPPLCTRCNDLGLVPRFGGALNDTSTVACPNCRETVEGKIYVLQSVKTRMYVTDRKGKARGQYWGLYIGHANKRYGASRFDGGPDLNRILTLTSNQDLRVKEVKR